MTFWSSLAFFAAIFPIVVIVEACIIARIKKNPSYLILIFPMAYTSVYYIIYLLNLHIWKSISNRELQIGFRMMIVLQLLSMIIYLSSKLWAYRVIKRNFEKAIEENANGRDNK